MKVLFDTNLWISFMIGKDLIDLGSHANIPILKYSEFITIIQEQTKDN